MWLCALRPATEVAAHEVESPSAARRLEVRTAKKKSPAGDGGATMQISSHKLMGVSAGAPVRVPKTCSFV